jgi:peroxiredoxin-like protein
VITLAALIERAALPLKEMSLDSEGIVDVTRGVITYKKIIHKPTVILKADTVEADYKKLEKLIHKAEANCMISRALRGNVEIEVQQNI